MTRAELATKIDSRLARTMSELKAEAKAAGIDHVEFSGTVAGGMVKTGIELAAKGGCPRMVLEGMLRAAVASSYGST